MATVLFDNVIIMGRRPPFITSGLATLGSKVEKEIKTKMGRMSHTPHQDTLRPFVWKFTEIPLCSSPLYLNLALKEREISSLLSDWCFTCLPMPTKMNNTLYLAGRKNHPICHVDPRVSIWQKVIKITTWVCTAYYAVLPLYARTCNMY